MCEREVPRPPRASLHRGARAASSTSLIPFFACSDARGKLGNHRVNLSHRLGRWEPVAMPIVPSLRSAPAAGPRAPTTESGRNAEIAASSSKHCRQIVEFSPPQPGSHKTENVHTRFPAPTANECLRGVGWSWKQLLVAAFFNDDGVSRPRRRRMPIAREESPLYHQNVYDRASFWFPQIPLAVQSGRSRSGGELLAPSGFRRLR